MTDSSRKTFPEKLAEAILRYRLAVGLALLAATAFMAYGAAKVVIATRFVDFFPRAHRNVLLNQEWAGYGGSNILVLMLSVRQGDIFNPATLHKIQDVTNAVNRLPGVDHQQVFSLASPRVSYAEAVPGGLDVKPFMFPYVPQTRAGIDELKRHVLVQRSKIGHLVSADNKSASVVATFTEQYLDYRSLFTGVREIVNKYQDANDSIVVGGEPIVRGYGYHYERMVVAILLIALALMVTVLYLTLGNRTTWWAPLVTGSLSALWGLGFVGHMGYAFDPVMLVIPFVLTARDFSHGIQWQGRYYDEIQRLGGDKYGACLTTTAHMLPPGLLSILADIAGIIFIAFGGIPVLEHLAFGAAVWLAASVLMVFVFQPVLISYLPAPRLRHGPALAGGAGQPSWWSRKFGPSVNRLIRLPVAPSMARAGLLWAAAGFMIWGVASGLDAKVGYSAPGTPLYRQGAKVNQDIRAISKKFPVDEGWIVFTTPAYPSENSILAPRVLRLTDELGNYLKEDPKVLQVISFSSSIIKPFNSMFHYGHPKYNAIPENLTMAGNLWTLFLGGSAPGEMQRYISGQQASDTVVRVLLRDHTYDTLADLEARLDRFRQRLRADPALKDVHMHYLGGIAGLYAAANDVLYQLDFLNITFVLSVIFLFSAITFRSFVAAVLFVVSCVLANFGAFIYMRSQGIGLTIDTVPVISLGIGLGVDYGIYVVARIKDEVMSGRALADSTLIALQQTGKAVFQTFMVMVVGIVPWVFSPMLFHFQMGTLLLFLMATNMVAGVLVLPAYLNWARPRFVSGYGAAEGEKVLRQAQA